MSLQNSCRPYWLQPTVGFETRGLFLLLSSVLKVPMTVEELFARFHMIGYQQVRLGEVGHALQVAGGERGCERWTLPHHGARRTTPYVNTSGLMLLTAYEYLAVSVQG